MAIAEKILQKIKSNEPTFTHLDLSYQNLTESDIEALAEALEANSNLASLDLTGNDLSLESIQRLATIVVLQALNLSGCKITAEGAVLLAAMPNLHSLKLNYNQLGSEGAAAFIDNMVLIHLELIDNHLSDPGAIEIAKNRHLHYLNVSSNGISTEGAIGLAEHPTVTHLILTSNEVGAFGAVALARNTHLRVLNLRHNRVGTEGAFPLALNSTLHEIDLGYNEIGKAGIAAIAENTAFKILSLAGNGISEHDVSALSQNQTLKSLDLSFNQINDVGTKQFDQNYSLTKLNVSYNYVSAEGAHHLAQHAALQWLDVSHNSISDAGGIALIKSRTLTFLNVTGCELTSKTAIAAADNTTLHTLHMDFNEIDNAGAIALSRNTTIRRLTLGCNWIEDEGAKALTQNTTLENLSINYNRLGEAGTLALQENTNYTVKLTLEQPVNFSSDSLKRLFLMSQEFLCILNGDGIIQFFNPTFSRLLGYIADDVLAQPAALFIHPDDRSLKPEHVNEKVPAFVLENRYLCQDGSLRNIHWRAHAVDNQMYAVGRDITALRNAEKKLHEHDEQLQLASLRSQQDEIFLQKQTDFIAHLCHEIRNPLSGVIGYLDILMDYCNSLEQYLNQNAGTPNQVIHQPKKDIQEMKLILNDIEACTEHQKVILDNNLDATMLQGHAFSLNTTAFDPKETVSNAVRILKGKAAQKQVQINVSLPIVDFLVQGDEFRFKQIVINFLSNALKFTDTGEIDISLKVLHPINEETKMGLKVKDTGIGMTPEEMDNLFQRFSQANVSVGGQYGGSGLGLFITKKLVELMRGEIHVKSIVGKGTTFSCTLKLATVVKELKLEPMVEQLLPILKLEKYRVLVVDDNIINQKVLKSMVERAGHICFIANDGVEAIIAFKEHAPEVIFMDILMPKMNGLEATIAIRSLEEEQDLRPTPIIALSGNAQAHDKEEALRAGMNSYITKPFKRDQIYEAINEYCQTNFSSAEVQAPRHEYTRSL